MDCGSKYKLLTAAGWTVDQSDFEVRPSGGCYRSHRHTVVVQHNTMKYCTGTVVSEQYFLLGTRYCANVEIFVCMCDIQH